MQSRFCFAVCCLPMIVTLVAVGLMVWTAPTREQRAIANLVKMGADISLFHTPDGARFFNVVLQGCETDDEQLSCILDIEHVQSLFLGAAVHEAGVKRLLRLRGLRYLVAYDTEFPPDVYPQLERDLKRNNPNLKIAEGPKHIDDLKSGDGASKP